MKNKNQLLDEIAEMIGSMIFYQISNETIWSCVESKLLAHRTLLDPADYCDACCAAIRMVKKAEAWS